MTVARACCIVLFDLYVPAGGAQAEMSQCHRASSVARSHISLFCGIVSLIY